MNLGMSGSPSAVLWAGGITVFHQGANNDGQLWFTYSADGMNWTGGDSQVPNVGVSGSPSAVVYNGVLFIFHQGYADSGELWFTSTPDGTNWGEDTYLRNLGNFGTAAPPPPQAVAGAEPTSAVWPSLIGRPSAKIPKRPNATIAGGVAEANYGRRGQPGRRP